MVEYEIMNLWNKSYTHEDTWWKKSYQTYDLLVASVNNIGNQTWLRLKLKYVSTKSVKCNNEGF